MVIDMALGWTPTGKVLCSRLPQDRQQGKFTNSEFAGIVGGQVDPRLGQGCRLQLRGISVYVHVCMEGEPSLESHWAVSWD